VAQPALNLKVAFLPGLRASADEFWLALGVIALVDAVRLSLSPAAGWLSWLLIAFFVSCAFMNRLRDAGRSPMLALAPLAGATIVKMVTGLFAIISEMMPQALIFFESQGVDLADPDQLYDPAVQAAYQDWLTSNPEFAVQALAAGAGAAILI